MRQVVVFCGSSIGVRQEFAQGAKDLAQALVAEGLGLVYGGGRVGLMGVVAEEVMRLKGHVIGIIPKMLNTKEVVNHNVSKLIVVETMHERKVRMAALSDAAIALPGGFGTLDESFEYLTWTQIGIHNKPFGLLNIGRHFDQLLAHLDQVQSDGFVRPNDRNQIQVHGDPLVLVQALKRWHSHHVPALGYQKT